jgi:hypothetical protein
MEKNFVRLELLQNLFANEAEHEAWVANVTSSVGTEGYGIATDDEGDVDVVQFTCDELEFADVAVYDFMGSAYEQERFYEKDIVVFKHKATGEYYVLNADDLFEF